MYGMNFGQRSSPAKRVRALYQNWYSFSLIFLIGIYNTYLSFINIFSDYYILSQVQKQAIKIYQSLYPSFLFDTLTLCRNYVIFGKNGTPYLIVSALYRNYYYYDLINLNNFMLIIFCWVSMINLISCTKIKTTQKRHHLAYQKQALKKRPI